jgi:hypothetical protein
MTKDSTGYETTNSTPTVENKMMASFRIDRDDWKRFGELAKRERLTVTQLITGYVEQCLEADRSAYGVKIENIDTYNTDSTSINHSVSMSNDDVLKLISTGNDDILKQTQELISTAVSIKSVQDERSIEDAVLEVIGALSIPTTEKLDLLITKALEPLRDEIGEFSEFAKNIQDEILKLKKALSDRSVEMPLSIAPVQSIEPLSPLVNRKTWGEYSKLVGMSMMPSNAAQKEENVQLRDRQALEAIAKAKELGLGVWKVSRAGRDFVRVEDQVNTPLPLFPINE